MNMTNERYCSYAEKHAPASPVVLNSLKAFAVGGLICALGQALFRLYGYLGAETETGAVLVSVTLVMLSVIFTALDLYDAVARFGGAGTLVPITGFANAVVAPAIDNKAEGYVLGLGAKLFTIAGPVVLYGTLASVIYGVVCFIKLYWLGGAL